MNNIQGLITSIIICLFPILFPESFLNSKSTVILYQVFAVVGLFLVTYFSSKILKKKIHFFLAILVSIELSVMAIFFVKQQEIQFSENLDNRIRLFYMEKFRDVPMYNPKLGKYDEELFYTLKQGNEIFENWEFSDSFFINSLGVRDDEESINQPEIVCLGDSFTMGWGVSQNNTFAELIESKMKVKTLNMGIASYGTAREYINLKKVNYSDSKVILLQFCTNDIVENRKFHENNLSLQISDKKTYDILTRHNQLNKSYYPFKYTFELIAKLPRKLKKKFVKEESKQQEFDEARKDFVADFFGIVNLIQKGFSGKVIIFDLESCQTNESIFLEFKEYLDANPDANTFLLDTSTLFDKEDYYKVDDHLNSGGHQKLSEAIIDLIEEHKMLE